LICRASSLWIVSIGARLVDVDVAREQVFRIEPKVRLSKAGPSLLPRLAS
jgi:hypothetical protein